MASVADSIKTDWCHSSAGWFWDKLDDDLAKGVLQAEGTHRYYFRSLDGGAGASMSKHQALCHLKSTGASAGDIAFLEADCGAVEEVDPKGSVGGGGWEHRSEGWVWSACGDGKGPVIKGIARKDGKWDYRWHATTGASGMVTSRATACANLEAAGAASKDIAFLRRGFKQKEADAETTEACPVLECEGPPVITLARKPVVYVAGPLTGSGMVWDNLRIALNMRVSLMRSGFVVFTPHLDLHTSTVCHVPEEFWLEYGLDCVRASDAVYRLPGTSPGTDAEVAEAGRLDIPVFDELCDLLVWRNAGVTVAEDAKRNECNGEAR